MIAVLRIFLTFYHRNNLKSTALVNSIITTAQNIVKSLKPKKTMSGHHLSMSLKDMILDYQGKLTAPSKGKMQQITKRQTRAYKAAQKRKAAMVSQSRKQNRK